MTADAEAIQRAHDVERQGVDRIHAALMLLGAAAPTCLYWVLFFLTDLTRPDFARLPANVVTPDLQAVYLGFESAFPIPDAFTAIMFGVAALYLWAGNPKAVVFGLIASGAMTFLALIDISFNLLHGFYSPVALSSDTGLQMEVAINIGCLGMSMWTAVRLWNHPLRRIS
jgi:hypothetical protein